MATRTVPGLILEQIRLGELDEDRRRRIEDEMGAEALQEAINRLEQSDSEILRDYPAESVAAQIMQRASATGARQERVVAFPARARRRILIPLAAAAAIALVAFVGIRGFAPTTTPGTTAEEVTRVKGQPYLLIYRDASGKPELVTEDDTLKESDRIQIKYVAAGSLYGAILSIDGRGAVTLHYPPFEGAEPRLEPNTAIALEHSYVLDDAPKFERFFFVTADAAFAVSTVLESAAALGGAADSRVLQLPEGIKQTSVLLMKEGQ